jgi:biopolymer transport protein ExbD
MAQSKVHKRGAATPEMNMTPLIDVTFQIIIFFMLINNIVTEQTVPMFVPELDDPKTRRTEEMQKIVINVAPVEHVMPGQYKLKDRRDNPLMGANREEAGAVKVGALVEFRLKGPRSVSLGAALAGVVSELEKARSANPDVEVELRADCALYYDQVQLVMSAITQAGIKTVHMVAYLPVEQRRTRRGQ